MATKAQLEAAKNSLLASGIQIPAHQHRQFEQLLIEELYDVGSRFGMMNLLSPVSAINPTDFIPVLIQGTPRIIPYSDFISGIDVGSSFQLESGLGTLVSMSGYGVDLNLASGIGTTVNAVGDGIDLGGVADALFSIQNTAGDTSITFNPVNKLLSFGALTIHHAADYMDFTVDNMDVLVGGTGVLFRNRGMEYLDDLAALNISNPRWIPDREWVEDYVDDAITNGVTVYNFGDGLTEEFGNVSFGGTLVNGSTLSGSSGSGSIQHSYDPAYYQVVSSLGNISGRLTVAAIDGGVWLNAMEGVSGGSTLALYPDEARMSSGNREFLITPSDHKIIGLTEGTQPYIIYYDPTTDVITYDEAPESTSPYTIGNGLTLDGNTLSIGDLSAGYFEFTNGGATPTSMMFDPTANGGTGVINFATNNWNEFIGIGNNAISIMVGARHLWMGSTGIEIEGLPEATKSHVLYYDETTNELSYGDTPTSGGTYVPPGIQLISGSTYLFKEADNGKFFLFTNSAGCTATIPTGLSQGWQVDCGTDADATVNFVSNGTLLGEGSSLDNPLTAASIVHAGFNNHYIYGALTEINSGTNYVIGNGLSLDGNTLSLNDVTAGDFEISSNSGMSGIHYNELGADGEGSWMLWTNNTSSAVSIGSGYVQLVAGSMGFEINNTGEAYLSGLAEDDTPTDVLYYNSVTGEITHGAKPVGGGGSGTATVMLRNTVAFSNPAIGDKLGFWVEDAATIVKINDVIAGSSSNVTWRIRYDASYSALGTDIIGATRTTSSTAGVNTTTFANPNVPAGRWIRVEITGVVGSPTNLVISVSYTQQVNIS